MLSTQDLLIVELPDDDLNVTREADAVGLPPAPPLPQQDTVTLARDDLLPRALEADFEDELTIDEHAHQTMDRFAGAPSVTENLDEDSWNDSTLDRTPPLPSKDDKAPIVESPLERFDTLTITGEAAVAGAAALPFLMEHHLEPSHTMTISGEEANDVALPFVRPKTAPPPAPRPRPPPSEPAPPNAAQPLMKLALRPPPTSTSTSKASSPPAPIQAEPPPTAGSVPRPRGPGLSLEQMMTIKRELFDAPDQRRDILASHGLTGLEWRLAERTLSRDLDDKSMNAERVRKLLGRA